MIAPAAGAADGGLRSDHPIVSFYPQRVGTVRRAPDTISLSNTGANPVKFGQWVFTGANPDEFSESDDCASVLLPAEECHVIVWHSPLRVGPGCGGWIGPTHRLVMTSADQASKLRFVEGGLV